MADPNLMDKSLRSVFGKSSKTCNHILTALFFNASTRFIFSVGNIPYEATEEKLKEIFSEVGPVLSFKYVIILNHILLLK